LRLYREKVVARVRATTCRSTMELVRFNPTLASIPFMLDGRNNIKFDLDNILDRRRSEERRTVPGAHTSQDENSYVCLVLACRLSECWCIDAYAGPIKFWPGGICL
jgi:hypothetical protein